MRRWIFPSLLVLGLLVLAPAVPSQSAGTRIYVRWNAPGGGDGTSWATAYNSLTSALSLIPAGSEVWVAAGIYKPSTPAGRSATFTLDDDISVYGGFLGDETTLDQRDPATNRTILSGDLGAVLDGADNAYHVVTAINVASSTLLDGFVVRDGNANAIGTNGDGAGLYVKSSSVRLNNLVIVGNDAIGSGGGLRIEGGAPTVSNVEVDANGGLFGGGAYLTASNATISNARFRNNRALLGGGVYLVGQSPVVLDTTFEGNVADATGGGAFVNGGTPALARITVARNYSDVGGGLGFEFSSANVISATVTGNRATTSAGGIYNGNADTTFDHLTLTGNRAPLGAGLRNYTGSVTFKNSIAWGNGSEQLREEPGPDAITVAASVIQDGCPAGVTCPEGSVLTSDPKLGPLASNGGATQTHAIGAGSSAIDGAGAGCPAADQRGQAPVDGNLDGVVKCDIGAVEYIPSPPTVAFAKKSAGGKESVTPAQVAVALSSKSLAPVTVQYRVVGGTAKGGGKDFTLAAGTLTIPPLATAGAIAMPIVGDSLDEPTETVLVSLSSPSNASLGAITLFTYRINDDDPTITCHGRAATIVGTAGNDTIVGTKKADVIAGLGGNDTLSGAGNDDVICGGPGNDVVKGDKGNDFLDGGTGNDRIEGGDGADSLLGLGGKDRLAGGPGTIDGCDGGGGVDTLLANHGCEAIAGVP